MRIAVVDCGSGNLASAARALAEAAARCGIAAEIDITGEAEAVMRAERIVLPGQGAFATCAQGVAALPGLREALDRSAAPFLGICVGMQLMARRGLEHAAAGTPGFGWIAGDIAKLAAEGLRLPHMGWNGLCITPYSHPDTHPLLEGVSPDDHVYFVHSYALRDYAPGDIIATTDYGGMVPAMVARGHRAGTQFHVEKSQEVGLRILANFLRWTPQATAGDRVR